MSAIQTVCPKCGQHYIAGMVGNQPFPAHVCPPAAINHPRPEMTHPDDRASIETWGHAHVGTYET